ncbi:MAG: phosphotransferase [Chloroflexi bacterium]|nr:phosphotransferase [Chloroflexota bacterium]MBV9600990.1 phosphotransferase [Chloroflexota bacterium]
MSAAVPTLVVISGTQGAGKSTVARMLAEDFERGAWISADVLQHMIVRGGRWPEGRLPSDAALAQLRLRLKHACLLGVSFVNAGFTAVIDDLVIGTRVEELLADLAGQRFVFVMLTPRWEVVRRREAGRGTRLWEQWEWLDEEIHTRTRRIGLWLDNSEKTPRETVEVIHARGWTEGLVDTRQR